MKREKIESGINDRQTNVLRETKEPESKKGIYREEGRKTKAIRNSQHSEQNGVKSAGEDIKNNMRGTNKQKPARLRAGKISPNSTETGKRELKKIKKP